MRASLRWSLCMTGAAPMLSSAIAKLQSVLDEHSDDQLTHDVRWSIQLSVAQVLIARGDLEQAVTALRRCTPPGDEHRRQLAREWLRIALRCETNAAESAPLPSAEDA